MKIIHTVSSIENPSAGPSYSVPSLAQAQALCANDVAVYSIGGKALPNDQSFQDVRFPSNYSGLPLLGRLSFSLKMREAIKRPEVQIVHSHGLWMMPNIYRSKNSPYIVTPRGMLSPVALQFSRHRKRIFRLLLQDRALAAASMFHATGESEYLDIRRIGLRQPVAIIPNGIDIPNLPRLKSEVRGSEVLSLGRIHPKKGLDNLILAWAKVHKKYPGWRLRIVGGDERLHVSELMALVHRLELNSVTIEPPVYGSAKLDLMKGASLFVLPSHSENFAMTVAESLSAEVPVISTKGAPWKDLETFRCGWWIDHGPEALAAALDTALSLPEAERRRMGARGRDWMSAEFSWKRIANMSLEAYGWLLGHNSRPTFIMVD